MAVRSFRDLRVWQMGMDVVQGVYELTRGFPGHERHGLAGQLQRAAVSIPSNIAEGHTRHHLKEYLYHLSIAQASLAEVDTQLEIAVRLEYISRDKSADIREHLDSLGKQIRSLRRSQKWLRKSEQGDKWNRCLIEGMIVLSETGARDEQTTPP